FCREWRSALVVKVLGRSVSYTLILKRLTGLWANAGSIQVTSSKNGYLLVRFMSGIDHDRAVTGGPWMVAVMKIGNRIGKPIRVDHATSTGDRSDYARVCVQVDITKPLLSQFTIHGITYFIQYEGL
ncbi:unnamed protein product, partial [Linum tenue]